MASRAYFLINVSENLDRDGFIEAALELERKLEVDFVDPVVGNYDLVVMVETNGSLEDMADSIAKLSWVKKIEVLKTVPLQRKRSLTPLEIESFLGGA
ncbi:MAG: hypothetical protein GX088_04910 [Clostridia bacterium]|nr:hypothetical protein [Clostridia bacterium]